jgi:dinuclear metal center YbgI/SA1388 family protein
MVRIKDIVEFLESKAPGAYQEDYDNAGLITGDANQEVSGVLICLDSTEAVIEEAIQKKCNLVIAHHPIVFRGLKKLTGKNYVERVIIKAIKHDIAIFAIHTNLDNVHTGVNRKIGQILDLKNLKILSPKKDNLSKLVTFVPLEATEKVQNALSDAGAGNIGNYKNCSFRIKGTGTFEPTSEANPYIGKQNQLEEVTENRIEVIFPSFLEEKVMRALKKSHPYEEVAYYLTSLNNTNQETGSGMIGELENSMDAQVFLLYLKEKMQLKVIKHTALINRKVKKVALCGGSGSFLLGHAIRSGADVFISSDFKYHEFFDADKHIIIADIGHYESEVYTKDLIFDLLNKNFLNIAIYSSQEVTNPISYL